MKNKKLIIGIALFVVLCLSVNLISLKSKPLSNYSDDNQVQTINNNILKDSKESFQLSWASAGEAICVEGGDQQQVQICSDESGGAIITWIDGRGLDFDIYAQRINSDGEVEWDENGVAICAEEGTQYRVRICSDGNGGAIIAWIDGRGSSIDLYAQHINSTGGIEWNEGGKPICTEDGTQDNPEMCTDKNGGAIITWDDRRYSDRDIFAQHIDSEGGTHWGTGGLAICIEGGNQYYPDICSNGKGGAIIAWADYRRPHSRIYTQHINSTGDIKWDENGESICPVDDDQWGAKICSDESEGAIIIWSDDRYSDDDLFAQRINSSRDNEWDNAGIPICLAESDQLGYQLCKDGRGGAFITWPDSRSPSRETDLFAQHINYSGGIEWEEDGKVICDDEGYQRYPDICSNENEGAIITWEDGRFDYDNFIYAQNISFNGSINWGDGGMALCPISGAYDEQYSPKVCSDQTGGALFTWEDERGSDLDVYATRIGEGYINNGDDDNGDDNGGDDGGDDGDGGGGDGGGDGGGGDDDGDDKGEATRSNDLLNFLLSPVGMVLVGSIATGGIVGVIIIIKKVGAAKVRK